MNFSFKKFLTHFFVLTFFAIAALLYFYPVLQGRVIYQSDIVQYRGMASEQEDFRRDFEEEPYWTNRAFGGMPTYQLGARYPNDYIKKLDRAIRFLPRPADYLFLYFVSFYILMCCMKVDAKPAVLGALAFGFSTYLIIILGVGHNAKAHALGYLPMLLGGIILVFRGRYLWGFLLTAFAMALEVQANHYQMTYYFMLLVLILGLVYLIDAIRKGQVGHYMKSVGLLVIAVALGILTNATALLATQEYAQWSTRGPSPLTIDSDGSAKSADTGLEKEYITQYSYGIFESLNIWSPRLLGGGSIEALGENSKTYEFLIDQGVPRSQALDFTQNLQLYWGEQPSVAAPAYVGAVVLFFFLLGLLLVRGRARWWLLGGVLLSLVLSWGKNFSWLTDLMIDYFPLYNKFRAVSSIQVVLELCIPILGILGLRQFLNSKDTANRKQRALFISAASLIGLGVLLLIVKSAFGFEGGSDELLKRYFGEEVMQLIRRDREAVYVSDTLRSMIFTAIAAVLLWLNLKGRLSRNASLAGLGLLLVIDLVGVNWRYVNTEDFVPERQMSAAVVQSGADQAILRDTSIFRVYNLNEGLNGARTSYFHQSLGGYHAAKPGRIQDLFEFHIYKDNRRVLNMLNTKYLIGSNEEGAPTVSLNPGALGNAWFVEDLIAVADADASILSLDTLDVSRRAVVNRSDFRRWDSRSYVVDSTSAIVLDHYLPNRLQYKSENQHSGLAVFSEMYYPSGWHAFIDGIPAEHIRVNYTLRALEVPAGSHEIEFRFEPEVVERGSKYALAGTFGLLAVLLGGLIYSGIKGYKRKE